MSPGVALLERMPRFAKKCALRLLVRQTAAAFRVRPPTRPAFLAPYSEHLDAYARFTRDCAEAVASDPTLAATTRRRLHGRARLWGQLLRRALFLNRREDRLRALEAVYRFLDIELSAEEPGLVLVRRCHFSDFYAPHVCQTIAGLDEGITQGLTGGRLRFSERITEGCERCLATLDFPAEDT